MREASCILSALGIKAAAIASVMSMHTPDTRQIERRGFPAGAGMYGFGLRRSNAVPQATHRLSRVATISPHNPQRPRSKSQFPQNRQESSSNMFCDPHAEQCPAAFCSAADAVPEDVVVSFRFIESSLFTGLRGNRHSHAGDGLTLDDDGFDAQLSQCSGSGHTVVAIQDVEVIPQPVHFDGRQRCAVPHSRDNGTIARVNALAVDRLEVGAEALSTADAAHDGGNGNGLDPGIVLGEGTGCCRIVGEAPDGLGLVSVEVEHDRDLLVLEHSLRPKAGRDIGTTAHSDAHFRPRRCCAGSWK
jgi:hypothetical protein